MAYYSNKNSLMKSLLIEADTMMVADEHFPSEAEFRTYAAQEKKGKLDTFYRFSFADIKECRVFEAEFGLQMFFSTQRKEEKTYITFRSLEEMQTVEQELSQKAGLTASIQQQTQRGPIIKASLYAFVAVVVSAVIAFWAYGLEHGEGIEISGGKRGLKRALMYVAETLGFYGSLGLVAVVLAVGVWYVASQVKLNKVEMKTYR